MKAPAKSQKPSQGKSLAFIDNCGRHGTQYTEMKTPRHRRATKFSLITLGCAKNLVDSEHITNQLLNAGYVLTGDLAEASFVFINTCGFIQDAKKEAIGTIFSTLQEKPRSTAVIVYGCLVQRYRQELERLIPEVDLFLPLLPPGSVRQQIQRLFPAVKTPSDKRVLRASFTPPSYKYIKVADGCDNFCTYCTIPLIRGRLKSVPLEAILFSIEEALAQGTYELNLIAQDITAYGTDLYGAPSLEKLLHAVLTLKQDFWLRLLYLHPTRIPESLATLIGSDTRIVKYLDMPLQHASNRVLKRMNRPYTQEAVSKTIRMLRKKIPSLSLRSSFMVGFPGETEDDYRELCSFIQKTGFDHLGVFEYSSEEDTKAFALTPRVPSRVKTKRKRTIMEIQKSQIHKKNRSRKGKVFSCLIEEPLAESPDIWTGRIYSQAPEVDGYVYVKKYLPSMGLVPRVRITGYRDVDLTGECIST